jgi:hypothetical protein
MASTSRNAGRCEEAKIFLNIAEKFPGFILIEEYSNDRHSGKQQNGIPALSPLKSITTNLFDMRSLRAQEESVHTDRISRTPRKKKKKKRKQKKEKRKKERKKERKKKKTKKKEGKKEPLVGRVGTSMRPVFFFVKSEGSAGNGGPPLPFFFSSRAYPRR